MGHLNNVAAARETQAVAVKRDRSGHYAVFANQKMELLKPLVAAGI
jgi:hypothetical protein